MVWFDEFSWVSDYKGDFLLLGIDDLSPGFPLTIRCEVIEFGKAMLLTKK